MDRFEETVHLVTDVMTGQEIHITADDSGAHISIPEDIDVGGVLVADGIAAETVVTTTDVCSGFLTKDDSADSGCGMEDTEEGSRFAGPDSAVSSLGELGSDDIGIDPLQPPSYGATVWQTLEMIKFKPDIVEELSSGESFVTLNPDTVQAGRGSSSNPPREASIRESEKREQDRLKKKLLRANPDYRQKEKERARTRMKLRRLDPVYRGNERQRDRQRRKAARLRDLCKRTKEIERQKEENILESVDGSSEILHLAGFEDSYSVVENVSKQCQAVESVLSQFDGT